MKYYLVGLFDKESYEFVENIQKELSTEYNLYHELPMLHVTLEIIETNDVETLNTLLNIILKKYNKFEIEVNGVICFEPPYKSVNLKINSTGIINKMIKEINKTLAVNGFSVRKNINDWDLHISLANTNFSTREWTVSEYTSACDITKRKNYKRTITVEKIELWKPINDKDEMVIKKFNL